MNLASRVSLLIVILCLTAGLPVDRAVAADFEQDAKLLASDGAMSDRLGEAVAVHGTVALVGARLDDDDGNESGSAYVYRFDGTAWVEEQKLTASDAAADDEFGVAVSVSGDVAVIGSHLDDGSRGSAYVYRFDGSTWVEEQKLTASDGSGGDRFGASVSVSGNVALIGALGDDSLRGSAYVYRFDGSTWVEEQKLTASDGAMGESFGKAVSLDDDVALIGAFFDDIQRGSAYVYRFDGSTWAEEQKLTASDAGIQHRFGDAVSLDGNVALIGAPGYINFSGAAYVFRFDGSTWLEEQKLTASDAAADDQFGSSVSVSADTALIGAGNNDDDGSNSGSAYAYQFDGTTWGAEQKLSASDAASDHNFGIAVSIDGDGGLIGAFGTTDNGTQSGSAYVFGRIDCFEGTVGVGSDMEMNTLFINGSTGGSSHTVEVHPGDLLLASLVLPRSGGNGKFALHADVGAPNAFNQSVLPFDVGTTCFPFLLNAGASPVIVANNIGKTSILGESEFFGTPFADPSRATTHILYPELGIGTVLTFQALMVDPGSASPKFVSTTNAVIMNVIP